MNREDWTYRIVTAAAVIATALIAALLVTSAHAASVPHPRTAKAQTGAYARTRHAEQPLRRAHSQRVRWSWICPESPDGTHVGDRQICVLEVGQP